MLPPYDRPINSFRIPRNREVRPRPASFSRTLSSRPLTLHRLLIRYWTSLQRRALRIYQPFSSYLQFPPFFPHHPNSRYEENRYIPFSLLFLFFFFPPPVFKKKFVILDLISSAERNFISPLRSSSFDTNFNKGQAAPGSREKCMRFKSTRLRLEGRPRLNRSSIVFLFFPSPPRPPLFSLSIWLVLLLFSPESSCSHNWKSL